MATGSEPAVGGGSVRDAGQVAVELGREEAGPAHLAVGHDLDTGVLLVADREIDRVVEHLGEVDRAELTPIGRVEAGDEPGRPSMRPDDAGQESARGSCGLGPRECERAGRIGDEQRVADRLADPAIGHRPR